MSTPKDPTDAPFIPSMGGVDTDTSDADDALALGGSDDEPQEDPVKMAQRLADEAATTAKPAEPRDDSGSFPDEHGDADAWDDISEDEARAVADRIAARAREKAAARQAKSDAPEAEDPRELAKRLVEEAKAKAKAAAPKEDPRALAKRLAEEAKAKAKAAAPKEDPRALAKRLAEQAKKKAQASAPKKPKASASNKPKAPAPEPADLMSRMGKPRSKRKSAAEILADARAADAAKSTAAAQKREKADLAKKMVAEAKRRAKEAAAAEPVAPAPSAKAPPPVPETSPEVTIQNLLPGSSVIQIKRPTSTEVLKAVWGAHLARAQSSTDLGLAVASSSILGALGRVGAEGLAAVEVRYAGSEYAVFIEPGTGSMIAAVQPAHVYLAGT